MNDYDVYYEGEIVFSRPITKEQQAHVKNILEREGHIYAHVQKNGICFKDSHKPEDAIQEIREYLATSTENPVELNGELLFFGGCSDGGMIITPEGIEVLDRGPFYVRVDACDEELIAELTRRGYAVTKKEK